MCSWEERFIDHIAGFPIWPGRLRVRSPDFQSGNTGSNPVRATEQV